MAEPQSWLETKPNPIKDEELPKYQHYFEGLQGNILRGHGRDYAAHLFLQFRGGEAERVRIKTWIRRIARRITSAYEQHEDARVYRAHQLSGPLFMNFFLSAAGYRALGVEPNGMHHPAFEAGMKARQQDIDEDSVNRPILNDPPTRTWEEGYQKEIHAMVLLADDDETRVRQATRRLMTQVGGIAEICAVEYGNVLRNRNGDSIEHFGYVDSMSQPLFFQRDVDKWRAVLDGQEFFSPKAGPNLVLCRDPHYQNGHALGSYLVFRKLEQNVRGFHNQVRELSKNLNLKGAHTHDRAGALVIGRFPDGTPIAAASAEGQPNLDFNFRDDREGQRCPLHAHIRKVNPRKELYFLTSGELGELRTRIVRRGMPYGTRDKEPIDQPAFEELPSKGVGLLFMCFQQDIRRQFERIQGDWADQPRFGNLQDIGRDPVIGRSNSPYNKSEQYWPDDLGNMIPSFFGGFVALKGGEYFFAPSIPYLQEIT